MFLYPSIPSPLQVCLFSWFMNMLAKVQDLLIVEGRAHAQKYVWDLRNYAYSTIWYICAYIAPFLSYSCWYVGSRDAESIYLWSIETFIFWVFLDKLPIPRFLIFEQLNVNGVPSLSTSVHVNFYLAFPPLHLTGIGTFPGHLLELHEIAGRGCPKIWREVSPVCRWHPALFLPYIKTQWKSWISVGGSNSWRITHELKFNPKTLKMLLVSDPHLGPNTFAT